MDEIVHGLPIFWGNGWVNHSILINKVVSSPDHTKVLAVHGRLCKDYPILGKWLGSTILFGKQEAGSKERKSRTEDSVQKSLNVNISFC